MDTIIIDDEIKSIELLEFHLSQYFDTFCIKGKFTNIQDALIGVLKFKPKVIFLDINMPSGSGIEFLEKIKEMNILTVFLTAHSQYAIEAIKLGAFDYLLKPINLEELIRVEVKIRKFIAQSLDTKEARIKFQISKTQYIFNSNDILYAHSEGNYTTIYSTSKKPLVITKNLKKIETEILNNPPFFRTHQSFIVNLNHVVEFSTREIVLSDGSLALLSSKKYGVFSKKIS